MELLDYHWKQNAFTEDYLYDYEKVSSRFSYQPWKTEALQERADWLDASKTSRISRPQLVKVLLEYNKKLHNRQHALHNIERLQHDEAVVLIGGQQAGLFTGPLMTIYKAVTTIQLAKKAEKQLQRPVIPMFWIAGEDHDFDEVNHIYMLSEELQIRKLKISQSEQNHRPISEITVSAEEWEVIITELECALKDAPYKLDLTRKLREFSRSAANLSDFFASMMGWLFEASGLVLIDSHDPGLRKLEQPMFKWMLEHAAALNNQLEAGQESLEALGYPAQVKTDSAAANLFLINEQQRILLKQAPQDSFTDKSAQQMWTLSELQQRLHQQPAQFSNNVLTRPLMQEFILPVLGTVLGSSEMVYWAQLKEAFALAGQKMPIIYPRQQYTVLERSVQKHMGTFKLDFADIIYSWNDQRECWLREQSPVDTHKLFEQLRSEITKSHDSVLAELAQLDPGLLQFGAANQQKLLEQVDYLQRHARGLQQQRHDASLRQWDRLRSSLHPFDQPQERVYNICSMISEYGLAWIERLLQCEPQDPRKHQLIMM